MIKRIRSITLEHLIEATILLALVIVVGTLIINRMNERQKMAILVQDTVFLCESREMDACGISYFDCSNTQFPTPIQNFRCMVNQSETDAINFR